MKRIYLDSNVFIAYIRTEIGKPFRLMFKDVEEFLSQCPEKNIIVLSDLAIEEIRKIVHYPRESTINFFAELEIRTELIKLNKEDANYASELQKRGIHKADALHAAMAINRKCDILLTFNLKDFEAIKSEILVREPTELIC